MVPRLLLLVTLSLFACRRDTSWSRSAGRQLQAWCLADAGGGERTLGSVTGVPTWERLVFVTPYSTPSQLAATHRFTWTGDDFGMAARDDAHVALFVRGTTVVQAEEWSRAQVSPSSELSARGALTPADTVRCGAVHRDAVTLEPGLPAPPALDGGE